MKKEVLEVAKRCANKWCFYNSCEFGAFPSGECIAYFAKAIIEQHERYRWHDLRKDPNDLPEDNDGTHRIDYEIVDESGNHDMCEYFGTAGGQYPEGSWELNAYCDRQVIAWREIEPFN